MFLIALGTNGVTTSNFYLMEASTDTAAGQATGKYNYRTASTAASYTGSTDALSARTAGASTALVLASTAETMYIIEAKNDDLSAGYMYLYPSISSAAATRNAVVIAALRPRYPQVNMMTVNT